VQVLEDHEQRLDLALADQQALDGVQGLVPALRRVEPVPLRVIAGDVEEPEQRGEARLEGAVEGQELAGDLLADLAGVVPGLELEVGAEQLDDRQEGGGLAVGDGASLQGEPAGGGGECVNSQ
jgi:hypothetical protein